MMHYHKHCGLVYKIYVADAQLANMSLDVGLDLTAKCIELN